MELIVFDLDGTLLNRDSIIDDYTKQTLQLLAGKGIAYTVATGRTLHASRDIIAGHGFRLPQVYKNGVVIWHPDASRFTHRNVLTEGELTHITAACVQHGVTPFVFTLEGDDDHAVYHPPIQSEAEEKLVQLYGGARGIKVFAIEQMPSDAQITNVSAIGPRESIERIAALVADEDHLVAYSGPALEGDGWHWLDLHHSDASKGGAITVLRELLGVKRVICFGDSDNDLSMFELADESYAPDNAHAHVKSAATEVIGHHNEEGIARFLRQRFKLPES